MLQAATNGRWHCQELCRRPLGVRVERLDEFIVVMVDRLFVLRLICVDER
jgi:hypothetical protein